MSNINVCLSCDDNYSKYAGVVIASIFANASSEDKISIYILDGGVSDQHKREILSLKDIKDSEISFVAVDQGLFEDYKNICTHSYISLPAYYRLKMASLLPDVSRVIYLDCDIVVNCSLNKLFESELGNNPFGGVRDINRKMLKKNPNYINSGVLVMDLDNIRKLNLEETIFEWTKLNFESIKLGDQEIINRVCENQITILDDEWNVQSSNFTNRSSYTKNPKIVHFVARRKPWHWASFSIHKRLYFKYLQLTPWKLSAEEYKHWTKDNQIASLFEYIKHRPIFYLRPRFYEAIFKTYII